MTWSAQFTCLLSALILDAFVGDPSWLWRRVPHPVVLMGRTIDMLDRHFNKAAAGDGIRKGSGAAVVVVLLAIAVGLGVAVHGLILQVPYGLFLEAVVAAIFIAQKSLSLHVLAVADALESKGLAGGRAAVSMIVGRDPDSLDEAGVSRAAIESLAENFSDGIVAPVLWYAVFGLPGLFAYKMLNTADSMIGHRTPRHCAFGWAAARLDDLANFPASRISALLLAVASGLPGGYARMRNSIAAAVEDARLHRSPNAGWPEAAMAGALGIALAGPRRYGEEVVEDPFVNDAGRKQVDGRDIRSGVKVFWVSCVLLWLLVAAAALVTA